MEKIRIKYFTDKIEKLTYTGLIFVHPKKSK